MTRGPPCTRRLTLSRWVGSALWSSSCLICAGWPRAAARINGVSPFMVRLLGSAFAWSSTCKPPNTPVWRRHRAEHAETHTHTHAELRAFDPNGRARATRRERGERHFDDRSVAHQCFDGCCARRMGFKLRVLCLSERVAGQRGRLDEGKRTNKLWRRGGSDLCAIETVVLHCKMECTPAVCLEWHINKLRLPTENLCCERPDGGEGGKSR